MSKDVISLELQKRDVLGKKVKQLRRSGLVPAVIHNHGKESLHVMADSVQTLKVYAEAGKNHPVELTVDGKKMLTLIKQAYFEPPKNILQHVVFQSVNQNEKVMAEVPLQFEGSSPAEQIGLVILRQLDHVEVEAFPKDLPDHIVVDATKLAEAGDKLSVEDLVVPKGVEIKTELEHTIATVVEPRAVAASQAEENATEESEEE